MEDPDLMFEHRLGSLLGKSIREVRSLSYVEYRRWQIFHHVEPWGWLDREYRTGAILAQMNNTSIGAKNAMGAPDFMRNMLKLIMDQLREMTMEDKLEQMTPEDRAAFIKRQIKKDFGIS